jgi:hypothetical protein
MAGDNHNRLRLQFPSLNLMNLFRSFISPQASTNTSLTETHFHFIYLKYKAAAQAAL